MKWEDLTMQEKAELMKTYVQGGYTSLDDIRNHFNSFAEGGPKKTFKQWQEEMSQKYPWLELNSQKAGYDYERYFNENYDDAVSRLTESEARHFTDRYKLPNHPTFSNESIYSRGPSYGGTWDQNDKFTPSIINQQQYPNIYKEYRPYSEEEIYSKKYAAGGLLDGPDDPPDIVKLIKRDVETVKNNPNIAVDNLKPTYNPRKPVSVTNYPASGALAKDKITFAAETLPAAIVSGVPRLAAKAAAKGIDFMASPTSNIFKAVGVKSKQALANAATVDKALDIYQTGVALGSAPHIYTNAKDKNYEELTFNILNVLSGIAGIKGLSKSPKVVIKSEKVDLGVPDFSQQVKESLQEALEYKNSQGYQDLIKRTKDKADKQGFIFNEKFFEPTQRKFPHVETKAKDKGVLGGYNNYYNKMSFDLSQFGRDDFDLVPYHEGLHWQRVGNINSPVENLSTRSTERFLDQEINRVLYPDADPYLRVPGELQANGLEAGKYAGVKPFEEYPGDYAAREKIKSARDYNGYLWDIKAGTEDEVKDFWKIMTGNFLPVAVPVGIGFGAYGASKNVNN